MKNETFVTDDTALGNVIRSVIQSGQTNEGGKTTYLRSLAAWLQIELGAKPLLATARGPRKKPDTKLVLDALERVNKRFYDVVLGVLNEIEPDAQARNARSGFARSAVSTLRRA